MKRPDARRASREARFEWPNRLFMENVPKPVHNCWDNSREPRPAWPGGRCLFFEQASGGRFLMHRFMLTP